MQPIEVIAGFSEQGEVRPIKIKRGSSFYQVDRVGRQWDDDAGKHFIVYLPVEKVMELVFSPELSRWYLKRDVIAPPYG